MKIIIIALTILLFSNTIVAQNNSGYKILNSYKIASTGGWDYMEVGPGNNRLYISHGSQVNILNQTTGDSVDVIPNTIGVHGIAFDVANNKGYTSNGKLNNVFVFDLTTNKILNEIPTGQNPDAIFYEKFTKKIITCNGRSNNLSIIDPIQNKVIDSVAVGGKPETAVSDDNGKIFVNVEDKNEIVAIDAKTFKVLNHWPLGAEAPTGLAYDKLTKRLFAGCEKQMVVMDATNGKVVAKVTIGDGCDGLAFDPSSKNIFTSNGEGNMSVIHQDKPNKYTLLENILTKKGARTITIDKATHIVYIPAAEMEPQAAGAKGRPKMIPGSFQILVIGK